MDVNIEYLSVEMLNFMLENKDITPEEYNEVIEGRKDMPDLTEIWGPDQRM